MMCYIVTDDKLGSRWCMVVGYRLEPRLNSTGKLAKIKSRAIRNEK